MEPFISNVNASPQKEFLSEPEKIQLESLLVKIFEINIQDEHQNVSDLRSQLEKFERKNIPNPLLRKVQLAREILYSSSSGLEEETKRVVSRASSTFELIDKAINKLNGGMTEKDLEIERQRRLMQPLAMLLEAKDRILSQDPMEIKRSPILKQHLLQIERLLDKYAPSDLSQARKLHGLDLDANIPVGFMRYSEGTSRRYQVVSSLDIADKKAKTAAKHAMAQSYEAVIRPAFGHEHFIPLESTALISPDLRNRLLQAKNPATLVAAVNIQSVEEIQKRIQAKVKEFALKQDYNSWATLIDFVHHFQKLKTSNPEITPVRAYAVFDPTPKQMQQYGDACYGQAVAILKILRDDYGLVGYVTMEKEGIKGIPMHASVVIPCKDGMVLVETLNKELPLIVIKSNALEKTTMFGNEVTLEIVSDPKAPYSMISKSAVEKRKDGEVIIYKTIFPLAELPAKAVMLKYIVDRTEFALMKEGSNHFIIVNVHDGVVIFKIGEGSEAERRMLPFEKFNSPEFTELLEAFSSKMNTPKEVASAQLQELIQNQAILNELLKQVRSPVPTYKGSKAAS